MSGNGAGGRHAGPDPCAGNGIPPQGRTDEKYGIIGAMGRTDDMQSEDAKRMREAIRQAKKAAAMNETPIGCVIVRDGKVIARGYNRRNTDGNTLAHAELSAIRKACRITGDWRLEDCTIYVTLEPCPMCAGAIVQARIPRCVIGAMNPKAGCAGSVLNLLQVAKLNHQVEVTTGVLEEECAALMTAFFRQLRESRQSGPGE